MATGAQTAEMNSYFINITIAHRFIQQYDPLEGCRAVGQSRPLTEGFVPLLPNALRVHYFTDV